MPLEISPVVYRAGPLELVRDVDAAAEPSLQCHQKCHGLRFKVKSHRRHEQ